MTASDFPDRLIPLSPGTPGLRTLMHVEIREPGKDAVLSVPDQSHQPVLEFVSSDESVDRYSEVISAAGWKLDNYRRNPVFQNAHQTGDILHTLGRALVTEVRTLSSASPSTALFQTIEFACDANPLARIAYGLYRGKFLNAVSVGFVPIRWQDGGAGRAATSVQENSGVAAGVSPAVEGGILPPGSDAPTLQRSPAPRRVFLEQELLEVSAVAIPANPNALALGLKSGAVDKSDLKDVVELFRSSLESFSPSSSASASRPVSSSCSFSSSFSSSKNNAQLLQMLKDFQTLLRS